MKMQQTYHKCAQEIKSKIHGIKLVPLLMGPDFYHKGHYYYDSPLTRTSR